MNQPHHPSERLFLLIVGLFLSCFLFSKSALAHPMPNSAVLLTIHPDRIDADVQIPLSELQAAIGQSVNDSSAGLVARLGPQLRAYLVRHIRPQSPDGRFWRVTVGALAVQETRNAINGTYRELTATLQFLPPAGATVRQFVLHDDAVLHQVVTHKILVAVRQDWSRGQLTDTAPAQVGLIELDVVNNRILPLNVRLEPGSSWAGFRAMVHLGFRHIAEGTDHLLFLLTLLLPATLLPAARRWGSFGGLRYSLMRLLAIVTAFTVGHSLTLLAATMGWLRLPSQPVEILIAISILVSALHALRPLFPGREAWVAAGFGLIHGLAFADTLSNLHLDAGPLALSLLGFNLGIEGMQLSLIALVVPWLILLSQTPQYGRLRITGALLSAVAAVAWILERVSGQTNHVTGAVEELAAQAGWILAGLALWAILSWWRNSGRFARERRKGVTFAPKSNGIHPQRL